MSAPTYTPEQIMERYTEWLNKETAEFNGLKKNWDDDVKDRFYTKIGAMVQFTDSLKSDALKP